MSNEKIKFPAKINAYLEGRKYDVDDTGLSGSTVILFDDIVLKIEPYSTKNDETVGMMRWLDGKLPVPKVIEYTVEDGTSWLLMSRIPGEMCCSPYYMEHSDEMVGLMAEGLKMLWNVNIADCPRKRPLGDDLQEALRRVRSGRMSREELMEYGFETAEDMAVWMETHSFPYDPVLSHGDYCLPNLLLQDGKISGFIDIGDIGIADRYVDIVTCWGSLKNNFGGVFGGKVYPDFDPDLLYEKLGIPLNKEKLRWCRLIEKALS